MKSLLIGNALCLIASLILISIGLIKTKKNILIAQCFQCLFFALGNFALGGYTGAISNTVTIIRNLYSFKFPFNLPAKIVFIAFQLIFGYKVNTLGAIGFLPIIAGAVFTWFLDTKSDKVMKIVVVSTTVLFTIYDFRILNISGFVFDLISFVTNGIGMYRILRDSKRKEEAKVESDN